MSEWLELMLAEIEQRQEQARSAAQEAQRREESRREQAQREQAQREEAQREEAQREEAQREEAQRLPQENAVPTEGPAPARVSARQRRARAKSGRPGIA